MSQMVKGGYNKQESITKTINISPHENKIILKKEEKIKNQCCLIAGIFLKGEVPSRKASVQFKMARNVIGRFHLQ